jgi:hypothetical protein
MNFQPELIALLVILVFAVIFLLIFRAGRRQVAEKKHLALTLGYEEVTSRPSQLISRVEALYKRGNNQGIQIDQVYSKKDWEEEFFIFDVSDANQDDNELGSEVFGVISSDFALPQFSLTTLPGFSSGSLFGGIMEGLLDKVLSFSEGYLHMSRIEFPDKPDFDQQVIVFGKDEAAVRELMDRIHLDSIMRIKSPVHIAGLDDFLTVDFSQMSSYSSRDSDLIAQHREFSQILDIFKKTISEPWFEPPVQTQAKKRKRRIK